MPKEVRKNLRQKIVLEFDGKCQVCKKKDAWILHHIIPKNLIHNNKKENLILICSQCHLEIHALIRRKIQEVIYKQNPKFFHNCIKELNQIVKVSKNNNLIKYHKTNPRLSITKLARIFHLSNTRIRQILKVGENKN